VICAVCKLTVSCFVSSVDMVRLVDLVVQVGTDDKWLILCWFTV